MGNLTDTVANVRREIEAIIREFPELADDMEACMDTLEGATEIKDVLLRLARILGNVKALKEGLTARIAELHMRENRFEARNEYIRTLIFEILDSANLKRVELPEVTLSLRNNAQRLVGDADPEFLPDQYVHIKRSIDRKAIRAALEDGLEVDGFQLSNAPPSLVVKVK